ncbi:utp14 protein [Sarocladium implicatum]|nr:utp14 protein [Sarocladium implicatum]
MPGRQAHGRSLIAGPPKSKNKPGKASKARSQKNALNAFGIAQDNFATRQKLTPRARQLDAQPEARGGKDGDDDDEDEEDDFDEDDEPQRKKQKRPRAPANDNVEYGSDSEGNEWQLGGLAEDDDDSEIESDDAFGDSDEEKFQGYSFKGSMSAKRDDDETDDDSNDDEGETLGEGAIDLATALDQYESESEDGAEEDDESGSDQASGSDGSDDSDEDMDEDEDDEDDEADPDKLAALQGMVSGFGTQKDDENEEDKPARQKISLGDLGLSGLDDPHMRKSLKLMRKEDKEKRPGATKKLDVPLSRREQGRIDRSVAYDKTNQTLNRWDDTVQQNRRADHLVFPLPENAATHGVAMNEIRPLAPQDSTNELESTIMGIMEQSGLSLEKEKKERPQEYDEEGNPISHREAIGLKRKQREENAREAKRQKRIKKIKSKAYHRVHRKERERHEAEAAEGEELDSEAEREAQDRRRALERVGQRHKESKWAKQGARAKRAVWDDEFRTGLSEMARRDEELRRRKEGRSGVDDDSETSSSGSSDEDDSDGAIRRELDELEQDSDNEGRSRLDNLKFMRNAAARKKAEERELLQGIRRTLDGEDEADLAEKEVTEVGRRQYGNASNKKPFAAALDTSGRNAPQADLDMDEANADVDDVQINTNGQSTSNGKSSWSAPRSQLQAAQEDLSTATGSKASWTASEPRRKRKQNESANASAILDTTALTSQPSTSSRKPSKTTKATTVTTTLDDSESDSDSDSDTTSHQPATKSSRSSKADLLARAFAGDDIAIEEEFAREKAAVAKDEDDKIVDDTLPGWGSWVGDGVSQRERKRHTGRFMRTVEEGVKAKDRKDAKLDRVIMNEKHAKKNNKYLATQLPHVYESKQQYERSLRLPVGPEWVTRETFKEGTKPRVLVKQGIITPMARPRM